MRGLTVLEVRNLKVAIEGREILKGVDLEVGAGRRPGGHSGPEGEIHVLMGPNGSGKSTLAQVIMGSPSYKVESGELRMENKDLKKLSPDKRAKLGIFMAFQHPVEVPGVSMFGMLRKARQVTSAKRQVPSKNNKIYNLGLRTNDSLREFRQQLLEQASSLKLPETFLSRSVNEGFSGGEKKRSEILQMLALSPKLVILDEIDSGLDVDALKIVADAIKQFTVRSPQSSILLITHYARILRYLKPDFVHIMMDGKIIKSGKAKLAREIEEKGYQNFQKEVQYAGA